MANFIQHNGLWYVRVAFVTSVEHGWIKGPAFSKRIGKAAVTPVALGLDLGQSGARSGKYVEVKVAWTALRGLGGDAARSAFAPYLPPDTLTPTPTPNTPTPTLAQPPTSTVTPMPTRSMPTRSTPTPTHAQPPTSTPTPTSTPSTATPSTPTPTHAPPPTSTPTPTPTPSMPTPSTPTPTLRQPPTPTPPTPPSTQSTSAPTPPSPAMHLFAVPRPSEELIELLQLHRRDLISFRTSLQMCIQAEHHIGRLSFAMNGIVPAV